MIDATDTDERSTLRQHVRVLAGEIGKRHVFRPAAYLRNPHYHTDRDTPETLDDLGLARATRGLAGALRQLSSWT
jgi:hypothetical protein